MSELMNFGTLYQYINQAERDDVGVHHPFDENNKVTYHIYNGKRQFNINIDDMPVAIFIFNPDENLVAFIDVKNGYADYDSPVKSVPFDYPIGNMYMFREVFGDKGPMIMEILRDQMGPYVKEHQE